MKVFKVSNACNACGECLLATNLLTETPEGFATPAPGRYIEANELAQAENLVRQCPVGALSIVDHSSTSAKGREGLKQLATILENRMKAVQIPNVSYKEVEFKESDYHVEHQWVDEYKKRYPSYDKACNAGKEQFRIVYWNHMKDFVANILVQYKSKVLRKYYDLSDPQYTYYGQIGSQMTAILEEIKAEAHSLSGSVLSFPQDFSQFRPEEDSNFKKELKDEYEKYIGSVDYVKAICDGFERYNSTLSVDFRYDKGFYAEECGEMEVKSLFRTSWRTAYRMDGVNEAGKRLIDALLAALSYPQGYHIVYRAIDDLSEENLNQMILKKYRELVDKEIAKKIETFKKVIE